MVFALGAGKLFDIHKAAEFEETIMGKTHTNTRDCKWTCYPGMSWSCIPGDLHMTLNIANILDSEMLRYIHRPICAAQPTDTGQQGESSPTST